MSRVSGVPGEGGQLRIDHSNEGPSRALSRGEHHLKRLRRDESGQAVVEFALILFPLLILVVGIIQFGIALNYWLDMNRLSNQGARWAVVNGYPGCNDTVTSGCGTSLQQYIACQRLPGALRPTVDISFPEGGSTYGKAVQVKVTSPYTFRAIMKLGTLTLAARTTMRIERDASRYSAGAATCP
jgi:Flp pilus assembly protein TadG